MIKKIILLFLVLFLVGTTNTMAQDRGFGIGVMAGEPTGISAKFWLNERSALDAGFGLGIGGDRFSHNGRSEWYRLHLHVDYLYHFFDVIKTSIRTPLYFGAGPRVNFSGGYGGSFGIRGVAGIAWLMDRVPLDVFVEAAPVFQVGHETGMALEGAVGVRYFF